MAVPRIVLLHATLSRWSPSRRRSASLPEPQLVNLLDDR